MLPVSSDRLTPRTALAQLGHAAQLHRAWFLGTVGPLEQPERGLNQPVCSAGEGEARFAVMSYVGANAARAHADVM